MGDNRFVYYFLFYGFVSLHERTSVTTANNEGNVCKGNVQCNEYDKDLVNLDKFMKMNVVALIRMKMGINFFLTLFLNISC